MSVKQRISRGKPIGWEAVVDWGVNPATGRRRRHTKLARTKAEALRLEREMIIERESTWGAGGSFERVGDWLIEWLRDIKSRRTHSTWETWETVIRLRVMPYAFAKMKLRDVTPTKARELVRIWEALPGAPRTKEKWFEALRSAFQAAVKAGEIGRNPWAQLEPPARVARADTTPSRAAWETLVHALWKAKSRYADVPLLLAYTGCRLSEITGATDAQLDIAAGEFTIVTAKTDASRARVTLLLEALAVIERARARQDREKVAWPPDARFRSSWFLRNQLGGRISNRGVEEFLQETLKKLGLSSFRPHDLRHYIATEGLAQGVDIAVLSKMLRHANISTTSNLYAHLRKNTQEAALMLIVGAKTDSAEEAQ